MEVGKRTLIRSLDGARTARHALGANLTEASMSGKRAIPPDDFPLMVDGNTIKSQAGRTIATTESEAAALQIAAWLNEYETRREEDRWSA